MDEVSRYREIVKGIINKYAQYKSSVGEVEDEVIIDEVNDHYDLMHVGWVRHRRIQGPSIHVDIRGGKIWVQHDGTSSGIVEELEEAGVPKDHIVLAFHAPDKRQYTGYAVS